jgi:hypothetical protein
LVWFCCCPGISIDWVAVRDLVWFSCFPGIWFDWVVAQAFRLIGLLSGVWFDSVVFQGFRLIQLFSRDLVWFGCCPSQKGLAMLVCYENRHRYRSQPEWAMKFVIECRNALW